MRVCLSSLSLKISESPSWNCLKWVDTTRCPNKYNDDADSVLQTANVWQGWLEALHPAFTLYFSEQAKVPMANLSIKHTTLLRLLLSLRNPTDCDTV